MRTPPRIEISRLRSGAAAEMTEREFNGKANGPQKSSELGFGLRLCLIKHALQALLCIFDRGMGLLRDVSGIVLGI